MYRGYKIIAHTAAGRRRYMQWLVPFVVAEPIVDVYEIWINTVNMADVEFFQGLARAFSKVKLVSQPDGEWNGNLSINAFYRGCQDEDAIYIRLDDDIVWMERDSIRKMIDFRIDNPDYFLVMPLVINNALSTYLLQQQGKIQLDRYYGSSCMHPILWESGNFAAQIHQWFIDGYLKMGGVNKLHVDKAFPVSMTRFSINCIVFWGKDMKAMGGQVLDDEEEYVSCRYPTSIGKASAWNGNTIMSHFAFYTQREQLDKQDILGQYGRILAEEWKRDDTMRPIHDAVQSIMIDIDRNEDEYSSRVSPYKVVRVKSGFQMRNLINDFLPNVVRKRIIRHRNQDKSYIISK